MRNLKILFFHNLKLAPSPFQKTTMLGQVEDGALPCLSSITAPACSCSAKIWGLTECFFKALDTAWYFTVHLTVPSAPIRWSLGWGVFSLICYWAHSLLNRIFTEGSSLPKSEHWPSQRPILPPWRWHSYSDITVGMATQVFSEFSRCPKKTNQQLSTEQAQLGKSQKLGLRPKQPPAPETGCEGPH